MIPKKACPGLNPGWTPVSRLREAVAAACILVLGFGGRSEVGKDHAETKSDCSDAGQPAFGGGAAGRCAAFTTPACVSAAAICCMRLMRSTAATGGSTKRQAG